MGMDCQFAFPTEAAYIPNIILLKTSHLISRCGVCGRWEAFIAAAMLTPFLSYSDVQLCLI